MNFPWFQLMLLVLWIFFCEFVFRSIFHLFISRVDRRSEHESKESVKPSSKPDMEPVIGAIPEAEIKIETSFSGKRIGKV